ncbi:MAG: restriction endonuclease [Ruminococcaceae bacterium]|nr:restriction endonuclease [Oscillospiraceae bacterium]
MSVPKFHEFMKPFLMAVRDGKSYMLKELRKILSAEFNLTNEELSEMLPSGTQTVFANRVQWAGTYLTKAGLLIKPSRGVFVISEEGKKVIDENPETIDVEFLTRYECFREFQGVSNQEPTVLKKDMETPDYAFEESFERINESLSDEILSEVMKLSPVAFEKMIIDLLQKMGYGAFENAGRTTSVSADEGIDGIIMEDKLGFNLIYIQAKHWDRDRTVGRPEIQNFVGAISGKGGNGLFVTTAKYAKTAIEYAEQHHIILIDGKRLAKLMIEHDFGVTVKKTFHIKELDTDTFADYDGI